MPQTLTIRLSRIRWTRRQALLAAIPLLVAVGAAWWYATTVAELPVLAKFRLPEGSRPLAFSPDRSSLAVARAQGGVELWDVPSGRLRRSLELELGYYGTAAVFARDGRTLVVSSFRVGSDRGAKVHAFDTSDGSARAVLDVPDGRLFDSRFSSDGSTFSVWCATGSAKPPPATSPEYSLHVWDAATWQERTAPTRPPTPSGVDNDTTVFAPDGQTAIRYDRKRPVLSLLDFSSADLPPVPLRDPASSPSGTVIVWFSPDSQTMARARSDMKLEFWDLKTKRLRSLLRGKDLRGYEWWIVSPTTDPKTFITTEPLNGRPGPTATKPSVINYVVAWLKRKFGPKNLYDLVVTVREVKTGHPRAELRHQGGVLISADGKVMATVDREGTITLWQLPPK